MLYGGCTGGGGGGGSGFLGVDDFAVGEGQVEGAPSPRMVNMRTQAQGDASGFAFGTTDQAVGVGSPAQVKMHGEGGEARQGQVDAPVEGQEEPDWAVFDQDTDG